MTTRRLTQDELLALTNNTSNRVGEIFSDAGQIRHYLYVTLLRADIISALLPNVDRSHARNRLQRYIREEFPRILGVDGMGFNDRSTKELYDVMKTVIYEHIQRLRARKIHQGKNSNESTTGRQTASVVVNRRPPVRIRRPNPAPAPAPAPVQQSRPLVPVAFVQVPGIGVRRRASQSPEHSSQEHAAEEPGIASLTGLLGDMNMNRRRRVRPRRLQPTETRLTSRQQAINDAQRQQQILEEQSRIRQAEAENRRRNRRVNIATARESVRELNDLIGTFHI
jgi:hypothetical protein